LREREAKLEPKKRKPKKKQWFTPTTIAR
jgi:hypothetical protein